MKIFFWFLIAANVILFTVMKSGVLDGGETASKLAPLHAEKIMLMTQEPAQSAPVASAQSAAASAPLAVSSDSSAVVASAPLPSPAATGACYEWGEFSGVGLEQVKKSLDILALGDKLSQHEIERVTGFWVYIAPSGNKLLVRQKLFQLNRRGLTGYFVVQDAGAWQNAIALGLFRSREAAEGYLQILHDKGVASAEVGEHAGKRRATVFAIHGVDAKMTAKLTALQKEFATSELKRQQCH